MILIVSVCPAHYFLLTPHRTIVFNGLARSQGAKDANNHSEDDDVQNLALQVHRMGHHVRRTILEQAKEQVGKEVDSAENDNWQLPETQEEINSQAEAAMRDLFPRIPNFDKQMILEHAFKKVRRPLSSLADLVAKLIGCAV